MSILIVLWLFFRTCLQKYLIEASAETAVQAIPIQEWVEQKFDDGTLHSLLEQRYEGFIAALKRRIPMAEFVMTGSLEAGLKEQVQTEIGKLLPDLKAKFIERVGPEDIKELIKASLMRVENIKIPFKYKLQIILTMAAVSFLLGLLQLLFFLTAC